MEVPKILDVPIMAGFPAARLVIERQPKKRGYRFRYASEGKTHGMLPGEPDIGTEKSDKKFFPTIKLENHYGPAKVVMTLVTDRDPYQMHAHTLLVEKAMVHGYHVYEIKAGQYKKELKSIAIQHAIKESLARTCADRILQTDFVKDRINTTYLQYKPGGAGIDIDDFLFGIRDSEDTMHQRTNRVEIKGVEYENLIKKGKKLSKEMNMSVCRLCFITFLQDMKGKFTHMLDPVYSNPIIDGKKKEGAPLKIIRKSSVAGSVAGGKEIWLLSDKVDPEDTEIHFWEKKENKDEIFWEGFGEFSRTDVYKQSLIVFKTPEYIDQNIDQPRQVNMQLRRKTDPSCFSEPHQFMFKPKQYDRYSLRDKRRKQVPTELFYPPPSKKQANEGSGIVGNSSVGTGFQPYKSDKGHRSPNHPVESEIPTLSEILQKGTDSPIASFNFPQGLVNAWPQLLLSNYPARQNDSGDESRGS